MTKVVCAKSYFFPQVKLCKFSHPLVRDLLNLLQVDQVPTQLHALNTEAAKRNDASTGK